MTEHSTNSLMRKTLAHVTDADARASMRHDCYRERIICPFDRFHMFDGQLALLNPGSRDVNGIVFKDEQAFEERLTTRHLAPTLHLRQRAILILPRLRLLLLELLQPGDETLLCIDLHPHRQRVDEEAHHLLDSR